jgi:hypothetical protein
MPTLFSTLYTEEAHEIICEAYTYGYPLVLMDVVRQLMLSAGKGATQRIGMNRFAHALTFTDNVIGEPGAEAGVLQSIAWLNVAKEPIVLGLPAVSDRYYAMHLMDGWMTAFTTLGTRTTGVRAGDFAIVGPRWSGDLPGGLRLVEAPTGMVWLVGRTQTHEPDDYANVHEIQQKYRLTSLSSWRRQEASPEPGATLPDVDLKVAASELVARMDASAFFGRLNALLADNPPREADQTALRRFAAIGVGPGRPFELRDDPVTSRSIDGSVRTALARIVVEATKPSQHTMNGWQIQPNSVGPGASDYMWRAVVALVNPGASPPDDVVSFYTAFDMEGAKLSGAHRYALRFGPGQVPPVNGFWSVAMHNARHALVPNAIDRHVISSADQLQKDSEGKLVVRIQHDAPAKRTVANWLPAPTDQFNLTLCLHAPQREVLGGAWRPPAVERVT